MPYYNKDPKRDPNFDNHPYVCFLHGPGRTNDDMDDGFNMSVLAFVLEVGALCYSDLLELAESSVRRLSKPTCCRAAITRKTGVREDPTTHHRGGAGRWSQENCRREATTVADLLWQSHLHTAAMLATFELLQVLLSRSRACSSEDPHPQL